MNKIRILGKSLIFSMSLILLASCQSHGENTSSNYHINDMQRLDADAGNEKMKRMERETYRDK